jgi:hypothetical protein
MRRYLVVANQTLGGEHLAGKVKECTAAGPCRFHIVVPASPPQEHLTWTEGEARAAAGARLDKALERIRALGVEVTGEVGDPNPILAIEDVLRGEEFDEIILSTLPPGASKWLKRDLLHRLERRYVIPVTHIVGQPEAVSAP